MLSLEKLAELYNGALYNSSDNDIAWLVSMFIRQFNSGYVSKRWSQTGGDINDGFVEYVKNSDGTLYNYFSTCKFIKSGNADDNLDVRHMSATMCVLLYKSTLEDGLEPGMMPEVYIDSLGGWAGDLQTLMNDVRNHFKGNATDYNIFKSKMQDFLGTEEHSFSMKDLYSDTDAYNIYKLTRNLSITEAYSRYYSYGHKKRYSSFTNNDPVILLKNTVSVFTAEKFMSLIRWPLIKYDFTKSESAAACDVFVDFIVSRRALE